MKKLNKKDVYLLTDLEPSSRLEIALKIRDLNKGIFYNILDNDFPAITYNPKHRCFQFCNLSIDYPLETCVNIKDVQL